MFGVLLLLMILEVVAIVLVGQAIGVWPTVGLIAVGTIGGLILLRSEGARAMRALQRAAAERRSPHREVVDGAVLAVGGVLLVIPGLVSTALGLLCVLPFTRPLLRGVVVALAARRAKVSGLGGLGAAGGMYRRRPGGGAADRDEVIEGEVVPGDVERDSAGHTDGAPSGGFEGEVVEGEIVDEDESGPDRRRDGNDRDGRDGDGRRGPDGPG